MSNHPTESSSELHRGVEGAVKGFERRLPITERYGQAPSSRAANLPTPGIVLKIVSVTPQPAPIDITPRQPQIIDTGELSEPISRPFR